ncbi:MAG: cysteine--tRNA ligase [Pseudanabaenaceae cyanobacterium]
MTLYVYNSLTRRKEAFTTLVPGEVRMYVCGVTVYDYCHLGHARAYIVWDTVRRYLQTRYRVRYVQNITDIDDKIIRRAQERGTTWEAIAREFTEAYNLDTQRLNIQPADVSPKATEYVGEMIALIEGLIAKGYAYAAGGDVYYAVQRFPRYGQLSGRQLQDMQAGASGRVDEAEPHKRYPLDFALWKGAKPGEPAWDSPWGPGRPGWHIECSAMARSQLGDRLDIHAGGADLKFPHHENEIAQSEAVTGQPFARYWLHNGFVNINGEKMSKSLGNFFTIRDLLQRYAPMAVRWFVLQAHYRQPIDFTEEGMEAATKAWQTVNEGLHFAETFGPQLGWTGEVAPEAGAIARFTEAMDDDFNTALALAIVFDLAKPLRSAGNALRRQEPIRNAGELAIAAQTLHTICGVLGFVREATTDRHTAKPGMDDEEIQELIGERQQAKKAKNYAKADAIRNHLRERGVELADKAGGVTTWWRV